MSASPVVASGDNPVQRDNGHAPAAGIVRRVAACVDTSEFAHKVIAHALTAANALGAPLTLLRVLEAKAAVTAPPDPVEWDIRRREARDEIQRLADKLSTAAKRIEAEVIEGQAAEQIRLWSRDHEVDLIVLCTHGESGPTEWRCGSTTQKLIERAHGPVLLVPYFAPDGPNGRSARYRRILVPLDGSSRAESVLPLAIRLAQAERADLLLAHVVPVPELTEIGPLEPEAVELREQLVRRNERVAHEYLDRVRAHVVESGFSVRTTVQRGGDVRSRLVRLIADEGVDLVVLSAHGRTGRSDVPWGSVATHLMSHIATPLLIVRRHTAHAVRHGALTTDQTVVRLPDHATP